MINSCEVIIARNAGGYLTLIDTPEKKKNTASLQQEDNIDRRPLFNDLKY